MSNRLPAQPTALTIAGSDSGGGAGIQADLKTFAALGVHGTSALTCVTAQNPRRVLGLQPCRPEIVRSQIEAVLAEFPPAAVKTGMLFSAGIIRVLVELFGTRRRFPLIVDPVMVATSGARLLKASALQILQSELLPQATLVTPNRDEAQILAGMRIEFPEDMRTAARAIHLRFGCAALVKGGHLVGSKQAIDIFYDGRTELLLSAPFVKGLTTHGTGCAYSAAIAGHIARGRDLVSAVQLAKEYITQAIAQSVRTSGHTVLNHFWNDSLR